MNPLRKAGALLLGVLIAILFTELIIRSFGIAIKTRQTYHNSKILQSHDSVRILCIGDSMTFGEYPLLLGHLLNNKQKGIVFMVIDGGKPGATSTDNLLWLERNITAYSPDMVLSMTGDHDKDPGRILLAPADLKGVRGWIHNMRVYRLYHYTRVLILKHKIPSLTANSYGNPTGYTPADATAKREKMPGAKTEPTPDQLRELERISALIQDGKDREGEAALLEYLRHNPVHAQARVRLAQLYARTGRRAEAKDAFERALKLEPENYSALCGLAELWMEDPGKLPNSAELLERAIALSPEEYQAFYTLGHVCSLQGKFDCAAQNLKHAAELRPDSAPALLELASAYRETERYGDSAQTLEKLLETEPGNSMAYAQLCSIFSTYAPDKTAFMRLAGQALKNIRTRNTVGLRVCAEQSARLFHELPLAVRLHEQALKLAPDDTDTLTSAAAFYKREFNDAKKSRSLSEKALHLNPQARGTTGLAFLLNEKAHAPVSEDTSYAAVTIANYRKMRQLLAERGIPLVAMQYPTRKLQPLKDIFSGDSGIYFVSNENMKELAERNGYAKYFVDMYAGDFGHCTLEGNALVAENAAKVILEEVLKR